MGISETEYLCRGFFMRRGVQRKKHSPQIKSGKQKKNTEKGIEGKEAENERKTGTDTGKGA
jgi:hypothetical protein